MQIKGHDVIWLSERQYVAVTYNRFGMGMNKSRPQSPDFSYGVKGGTASK